MSLVPIGERLLIRETPKPKMERGIHLPDQILPHEFHGEVVAVGSKVKDIKPGDYVYYPPNYGIELVGEDGVFLVMFERDIHGKLDG